MSYANLVMLWLFGGRNNIFLWATGWSFATFNLFHRSIAYVATLQAVVHSIGYTVLASRGAYQTCHPQPKPVFADLGGWVTCSGNIQPLLALGLVVHGCRFNNRHESVVGSFLAMDKAQLL
jgi:hypothetical protein